MQALVRKDYGSVDVLTVEDVPRPAVAGDEVLVRVAAAGLDRGALHVMTGKPYLMRVAGFGVRHPKHPGLECLTLVDLPESSLHEIRRPFTQQELLHRTAALFERKGAARVNGSGA